MAKAKLIFFLALLCGAIAHKCTTDEYMEMLMEKDPQMRVRIELDEIAIRQKLSLAKRQADTIYTIPTVVHILYNQPNAQGPTDQQVRDQIGILLFFFVDTAKQDLTETTEEQMQTLLILSLNSKVWLQMVKKNI